VSDWTQDDEFWMKLEAALFSPDRIAAAVEEAEYVIDLAGCDAGARILDMPCGPGRHSIELARRGYEVTGVDRTAGYLARARERAAEAGVRLELVEEDMRAFRREGQFDVAINLFSSFGYFSEEENQQMAENIMASLAPGGAFVLEMAAKEVLAGGFWPRRWHPVGDGFLLEHTEVIDDWARMKNRWVLIEEDGSRYEAHFQHRLYSGAELRRVLEDAGAVSVELYGNLEGAPYDQDAERLVAVAFKG